jgi:hypothetical protein
MADEARAVSATEQHAVTSSTNEHAVVDLVWNPASR